jgi:uncharacterized protein (TIGR03118 family)
MVSRAAIRLCLGGLLLALGISSPAPAQEVTQTNLVSDQGGVANNQDVLLINAFGLARGTGTNWMVTAKGSAQGIVYDGFGNAQSINVNTPSAVAGGQGQPTGVVFNGTNSFNVPTTSIPAQFLFATADGLIEAYNPGVDAGNAFIAVNNSTTSSYTGLTIAEVTPGVFHLFAANFKKGTIDVFDGNFKPVTGSWLHSESESRAMSKVIAEASEASTGLKLAPYNVQTLGKDLVITFAVRNSAGQVVAGNGFGVVVITGVNGHFVNALFGASLNAPYGIAEAPADFGRLSHLLLIGNTGSGKIAAFDTFSGKFVSFVEDSTGAAIVIDGLHGLGFGATGAAAGDSSSIFLNQASGPFNALNFAAGPNAGAHGLLGNLIPNSGDFVLGEQ